MAEQAYAVPLPGFAQIEVVATPDRVSFGNMAKEGVAKVWNNDAYRAFRARLASSDPPDICRGCALYNGTF